MHTHLNCVLIARSVSDRYVTSLPLVCVQVRLGLMTADYLQHNVKESALIKDSVKCDAAVTKFIDLRCRSLKPDYSNRLSRPRLPSSILLVTGGRNGAIAVTGLDAYDVRADCWVPIRAGEMRRVHHGAALLDGFMYVIGGSDREINLNTVEKFDFVTRAWHPVMAMNHSRCHVCVAVQNGCIYAFGGFSGHSYYSSVERYSPEADQWTMVAPMRSKRCSASATTLNGKVGEGESFEVVKREGAGGYFVLLCLHL